MPKVIGHMCRGFDIGLQHSHSAPYRSIRAAGQHCRLLLVPLLLVLRHSRLPGRPNQAASLPCSVAAYRMLSRASHASVCAGLSIPALRLETSEGVTTQVLAFVNAYLLQSEDNELAVWGVAAGARCGN